MLVLIVPLVGVPLVLADPFQNALDGPNLEWQASPGWQMAAGAEALDGEDAVTLEAMDDEGTNEVIHTSVTGPGVYELWWSVRQGDDENDMTVEIDGTPHLQREGDPYAWEPVRVNVPAGNHTIGVRVYSDGGALKVLIDQASWTPGGRFPAAVAMGDADGRWISYGDWRLEGGGVDGNGDEARLSLVEGPAQARLLRLLEGPARVHYWSQSLGGLLPQGQEAGWQRQTQIVGGRENQPARFELDVSLGRGGPAGSHSIDSIKFIPLSQPGSLDLPASAPRFEAFSGAASWMIAPAEAWPHGTGSAALVPGVPGGGGRIEADFDGPGLLTWSWQKWSNLDERMTVTANGSPLGVFLDDGDDSGGFELVTRLMEQTGPITVAWEFLWGDNGWNPISLDDMLFSPPAAADLREAVDVESDTPVYISGAGATAQSLVTHDGAKALEIAPGDPAGRTAVTLTVTGPGVLSWWWRADLPEPATFSLGRQGRVATRLIDQGIWRQSHLVIREGQEWLRWEVCANGAPLTPASRVWLDQIVFSKAGVSVARAVDRQDLVWGDSGGFGAVLPAPWSADGTDVLVLTGPHGTKGPASELSTVISGPTTLSFSLRSESDHPNPGAHWLLQMDDTFSTLPAPGPASDWQRYLVPIGDGEHVVRWHASPGAVVAIDQIAVEISYDAWEQSLPEESRDPLDDPDGDGIPTLIEYAFGTSPLESDPSHGMVVKDQDGRRTMEFSLDTSHVGVVVSAEVSDALVQWQEVPTRVVSRSGTIETHQVELTTRQPFGRLRVQR